MAVTDAAFRVLQQRVAAVEGRLSEIDSAFGETLYRQRRDILALRLEVGRLLDRDGVRRATDAEIDAALEAES